ncbi:MAG: energy transducer TonB [Bacteroidales bacterium]
MKTKKSFQSDLEKQRTTFFQLGMLTAIALSLIAFEWSGEKNENATLAMHESFDIDDVEVINTFRKKKEKEKLPVQPIPEFINITNDDNFLQTFEPEDIFIDENTEIPDYDDLFTEDKAQDEIFVIVEDMPTFRGGDKTAFWKYIQQTVGYPEEARNLGLEGTVHVSFVVDEDGKVTAITIARGVDKLLDDAVINALETSPKWKPGKQRGKAVKVAFSLPVKFKLN